MMCRLYRSQLIADWSVGVPDGSGPATRACDGCSQDPDKGDCWEHWEEHHSLHIRYRIDYTDKWRPHLNDEVKFHIELAADEEVEDSVHHLFVVHLVDWRDAGNKGNWQVQEIKESWVSDIFTLCTSSRPIITPNLRLKWNMSWQLVLWILMILSFYPSIHLFFWGGEGFTCPWCSSWQLPGVSSPRPGSPRGDAWPGRGGGWSAQGRVLIWVPFCGICSIQGIFWYWGWILCCGLKGGLQVSCFNKDALNCLISLA